MREQRAAAHSSNTMSTCAWEMRGSRSPCPLQTWPNPYAQARDALRLARLAHWPAAGAAAERSCDKRLYRMFLHLRTYSGRCLDGGTGSGRVSVAGGAPQARSVGHFAAQCLHQRSFLIADDLEVELIAMQLGEYEAAPIVETLIILHFRDRLSQLAELPMTKYWTNRLEGSSIFRQSKSSLPYMLSPTIKTNSLRYLHLLSGRP